MDSGQGTPGDANEGCIAGRYRVRGELGRGGMAAVYRVDDLVSGRELALKQLSMRSAPKDVREASALFEREYHTLAQLSHPRVIAVYDYGVAAGAPYYTMELLDGEDLRERSPLPFREACALLFDVCSSLALLHSRRLVHRDISPRNIRCTQSGQAKLLDFGALVPMGAGGRVVGTPPFVAPEVLYRLTVDARTDLFSLGATLYYALTGASAFPARDFSELADVWSVKPHPPSSLRDEVPAALDALVMSLINLDPALRPRTAFEVMQRLAAIAGSERVEPVSVSQAYLATPVLVGRDAELAAARDRIAHALGGRGGGVLIGGGAGVGRSRMLDACVLEAKVLGASVLRTSASAAGATELAAAHSLAEQVRDVLPEHAPPPDGAHALTVWFADLTRRVPFVIAVDDVEGIDEPSAALLAALLHRAERQRLLIVATCANPDPASCSSGLALLAEQCAPLPLAPLDAEQTLALLASVFGDAPNIGLVGARIHEAARGNPRECMDLAQHLVDRGRIRYEGGSWILPGSLDAAELPSSAEQVLRQRLVALQPLARRLAEAQSLASHAAFSRQDYSMLAEGCDAQRVDEAINELVAAQLLAGDGRSYSLAHGAASIAAQLDCAELEERHRTLAELYEKSDGMGLCAVRHWLAGGLRERALDRLAEILTEADEKGGALSSPASSRLLIVPMLLDALSAAVQLGRPPREVHQLRKWLTVMSIVADDSVYWLAAPPWLEQLEHDSGLALWRQMTDVADPGERLRRALAQTAARYASTAESERVFRPDEAIKLLVHYVVTSIAIGARTLDARLIASLPPLLEPFAPLSPLIEAMWQNAICTYEANCSAQQDRARLRAIDLYGRLAKLKNDGELRSLDAVRNALAYCAGAIEARLGLQSAVKWAAILDKDPLQRVNAMHIRKIVRLQQGDPEGAERYRKQAEVLAAQARARQMFTNTLGIELNAYATAHDLAGVQQTTAAIEPLARRHPGWLPVLHLAEGHFKRLCGELEHALDAYDRCLALHATDPAEPWRSIATWPRAVACRIEVLIGLGRFEQAKAEGECALAFAAERGLGVATHDIARALALAEAKLNDYPSATARLDRVIAEQKALGVSGLNLGTTYETRARIAIATGDTAAVEEYGRLTAQEYRHGRGSPLGALYERLMSEARRAGVKVLPQLSEFESTMMLVTRIGAPAAVNAAAELRGAGNSRARAICALQLICTARGANGGHLYLFDRHGLCLAVSQAAPPPDEGLLQLALAHVADQLEPEMATAPLTETSADSASVSVSASCDRQRAEHHALLVTCAVEGVELCAGLAVLRLDPTHELQAGAADTVALVGATLIEAGDTLGVPLDRLAQHLAGPRAVAPA